MKCSIQSFTPNPALHQNQLSPVEASLSSPVGCFDTLCLNQRRLSRTHHLDGHAGQVLVGDGRPVALHHVDAFPGEGLDDGQVGLQGGRLLRLEDERVDATVELPGQHEADDWRLDVLLLVLVGVERVR